jgi:hypothetical protein
LEAADINWRPLGALFVEAGLLTGDELEEALGEQTETSQRLGEILLSRGLVSPQELTRVLVDQLGRELERERGHIATPDDLARRRESRPSEQDAVETPEAATPAPLPAAADSTRARAEPVAESGPGSADDSTPADDDEPAVGAAASRSREVALPPPFPEAVLVEDNSADADLVLLVRQVDELRHELARETASRESALAEASRGLETRIASLEATLADERAGHRRTFDELERAQAEAGSQARELGAAVANIRSELQQIDAAVAWFEYWSSGAAPSPPAPRASEA